MFALTFVSGVLYLIQERRLKEKTFTKSRIKLPSLELLSRMILRFLLVGFPLFSFFLVISFQYYLANRDSAGWKSWVRDPLAVWGIATWFFYALLLHLRLTQFKGKKLAVLSILTFTIVICWYMGATFIWKGHNL